MSLEILRARRISLLPILCLALLFFFHFAVNCFVILNDELPFANDPAYVYGESLRLYGTLRHELSRETLSRAYDEINFIGRLHPYRLGYDPQQVMDLVYREAPPGKWSLFVFQEDNFYWALKNEVFIKEHIDGIDIPTFHNCREQRRPFIDSWLDTEDLFEMMRNTDFVVIEDGEPNFGPVMTRCWGRTLASCLGCGRMRRGDGLRC